MELISETDHQVEMSMLGEFTWDIVDALPHAYYYKTQGKHVKIKCHPNLQDIYYFVDEIEENNGGLNWSGVHHDTRVYDHKGPDWRKKKWVVPPIKDHFKEKSNDVFAKHNIILKKPLIVINNKHSTEWNKDPQCFLSLEFLDKIVGELKHDYDVAYIRPFNNCKSYYYDHQAIVEFDDYKMLKEKHPETILISDYDESFNKLQCCLEANSEKHITIAGGNACLAACFGGEVIILNDKTHRGIWQTDSWLSELSGAKIYGYRTCDEIKNHILNKWVKNSYKKN